MKRHFMAIGIAVFLAFYFTVGSVSAEMVQLKHFTEVLETLKAGYTVKAVFHYKLCKLINENEEVEKEKVPDAIGGMELVTFEYFATNSIRNKKAFIAFSEKVLIDHVTYDFVNNYVKVRIYDDNTVRIIAKYLAPNTNEVKMDESFYTVINDGKNNGGAYFYVNR